MKLVLRQRKYAVEHYRNTRYLGLKEITAIIASETEVKLEISMSLVPSTVTSTDYLNVEITQPDITQ